MLKFIGNLNGFVEKRCVVNKKHQVKKQRQENELDYEDEAKKTIKKIEDSPLIRNNMVVIISKYLILIS